MATTLNDLYTQSPGTAQVAATPNATASHATGTLAQAKDAAASSYDAQTQQVDPTSLTSNRLNTITAEDSPLMARARQEGMLLAAKRGLQNSSIAAGTAEGAMVDRATPLAQQESAMLQEQAINNQNSTNAARGQNAVLATDVSKTNAQLGTSTSQQNAALQTDVSKQNAAADTSVSQFNADTAAKNASQNAASENAMRTQVMNNNAELNKQYLTGTQTMDLATIQGRYQQLLAQNAAASNLYNSYFESISQTMANTALDPGRIAQIVGEQQAALQTGLQFLDAMNSLDLGGGTPSPAPGSPNVGLPQTPTGPGTQSVPSNTAYAPPPTASLSAAPASSGGGLIQTAENASGSMTRWNKNYAM